MIDYENILFNNIYLLLRESYPDISMSTDFNAIPTSFPHVTICEIDNTSYERSIDTSCNENHINFGCEINIYSKIMKSKKSLCKDISQIIDNYLIGLGFTRSLKKQNDTTSLYRLILRYKAIISKNLEIYRR